MIGVDRAARAGLSSAVWRRGVLKAALCLVMVGTLVAGFVEPAAADPTDPAAALASLPATTDTASDADPADVAVDGFGDAEGYHVQVSHGGDGFSWHELAVLRPADMDVESWTGYQCLSGDGRFAAVTILPSSQANDATARDHGAFAYSVDLGSGEVHSIASGVGLKYYSPGCGTADSAVVTTMLGTDQASTVLSTADLTSGAVSRSITIAGQVTSSVPTATGLVGVMGSTLVSIGEGGAVTVVATVKGDAYDLRPAADGGIIFSPPNPAPRPPRSTTKWAAQSPIWAPVPAPAFSCSRAETAAQCSPGTCRSTKWPRPRPSSRPSPTAASPTVRPQPPSTADC